MHPFSSLFKEHFQFSLPSNTIITCFSIQLTPTFCVFSHSDMKGLFKPVNQTSTPTQSS